MPSDYDVPPELLEAFSEEADDLVKQAGRDLLLLETPQTPQAGDDSYRRVARVLHTLKGSAATVGLDEPARLAHALEDFVGVAFREQRRLPAHTIDRVLPALDALLQDVRDRARGTPTDRIPRALEALRTPEQPVGTPAPAAPPIAAEADARAPEPAPAPAPAEPARSEPAEEESWRIQADEVRSLLRELERARELRRRLELRARQAAEILAGREDDQTRELVTALGTDAAAAASLASSSEMTLRRIGTQPFDTIIEPLRRAVRDCARARSRDARLSVVGADLRVDRRLAERLRGMLLHLVRNAVAHGIEAPEARERRGKHPEGVVTIRAEEVGSTLLVSVEDDGQGLDLDRIRQTAVERGLTTADRAARATEPELVEFLFRPGFSTASTVSEEAGRGVGLDVVRAGMRALGGEIEVVSRPGHGARFVLSLPYEMGTTRVLVVVAAGETFGVPLASVAQVVRAESRDIAPDGGVAWRARLLPAARLSHLLGLAPPEPVAPGALLVVLHVADRFLALAVDGCLGEESALVRPLPDRLRSVRAYKGATAGADGRVLLVASPEWIVESASRAPRVNATRRALVVDDSLTARALHRTVLEAAGWEVHAAAGGPQGLSMLGASRFEAVVCDIGMDGMDGFEVTRRIREGTANRDAAVVLVSAHDGPDERQRGIAAGADAFVSKRECASGLLLDTLRVALEARRGAT